MRKKVIPCNFTSVGLQVEQRRIGVRIDRSRLGIDSADELFSGHRLTGTVEVILDKESADQIPLIGGVLPSVKASFDVKSFTVKPESFTCGLIFARDDIAPDTLDGFLNRSGKITVTAAEGIPEEDGD